MSVHKLDGLANTTMFETFFEHSPCGIIVTDMDYKVICVNSQAKHVMNIQELAGVSFLSLFSDTSKKTIKELIRKSNRHSMLSIDVERLESGSERWLDVSVNNLSQENGFLIWGVNDISSRKSKEKELEELAYYDELTGLYTRHHFFHLANNHIKKLQNNQNALSILMLDLDNFKSINDTYGHSAGDHVLQAFSSLVTLKLRKSDAFGRIGGEEFAIVLPETTQNEAVLTAIRICQSVEEFFSDYKVTVSIGIVTIKSPTYTVKQLLTCADSALYQVKKNGKNNVKVASIKTLKEISSKSISN